MSPTVDIMMPALGQSVAEGTVTEWLRKPGDRVAADEALAAIETDKAQAEVPAPAAGALVEILVPAGATVAVGTVLARFETSAAAFTPTPAVPSPVRASGSPAPAPVAPATLPRGAGASFLSPAVRRMARERGMSQEQVLAVAGTGRGGRISLSDLRRALEASGPAPSLARSEADVTVVPLAGMRARIAEHMLHAQHAAAHVHTVAEADVSAVAAARARHGADFEARHGFPLSWNAFLLKATAAALAEFPAVNAVLDERGLVQHSRVHLGMAVALEPTGLVVPVIRDAHARSIRDLALEARRLTELARSRRLKPDDMAGGTCTLTNPGVFGNLLGTPIIHVPQVAIVDFGAIKKRPVVLDGDTVAIRPMVYVVVGWDHRAMDGATAARFLARLVKLLETLPPDSLDA